MATHLAQRSSGTTVIYGIAVLYMCVIFLRPTELVPSLQDVPVALLASAATAPFVVIALIRARRVHLLRLPHDRYLVAFWAAIVLSNVVGEWFEGAMLGMRQFGQVVYQYVLLRVALSTPERLRGMLTLFAGIMLFHALSGVQQRYAGVGFGGILPVVQEGQIRIRGLGSFNDPNDLAVGLLAALPILATVAAAGRSTMVRLAAMAALLPVLMALYFTNSRGGVLGLMAMVAVFCWRRYRGRGAAVAIVVLAGVFAFGPSRLSTIDSEEESAQGRLQAWSDGLQMFKSQPVTGVGFNRFTEGADRAAHNSLIHTFAELGALGGICLVGMGYWYHQGLVRVAPLVADGRQPLPEWHNALFTIGVGLLGGTSFLSRQYDPLPYTLLAMTASYVNLGATDDEPAVRAQRGDLPAILVLSGAILVASYIVVKLTAVWNG